MLSCSSSKLFRCRNYSRKAAIMKILFINKLKNPLQQNLQNASPNQVIFHMLKLFVSSLSLPPKVRQIKHQWPWEYHHLPVGKLIKYKIQW